MEVQLGHSKMNCGKQASIHIEQGIIQSHQHLTRREWSHSELLKLRLKFTMTRVEESTCECIKELGIKRRFRDYHNKGKPNEQTMKRKDQNQGVHLQFLKELNKVFLPKERNSQQYIKIGIANVRSTKGKTKEILHHVIEENLDLTLLSETWIDNDDDITKAKLKTENLKYMGNKERSHKGGGLGIIYKTTFTISMLTCGEIQSFEYCIFKIGIEVSKHLTILLIYRPPYSAKHPISVGTFLEELEDFIGIQLNNYPNLIILGDLNIHDEDIENIDRRNYHDLLDSFDLKHIVEVVTHEDGHTLDHIVIPTVSNVQFTEIEQSQKISDHYFIHANISFIKPAVKRDIVNYRCFKGISEEQWNLGFKNIILGAEAITEIEELATYYDIELAKLVDKLPPIKHKLRTVRVKPDWMDDSLTQLKCKVNKYERVYRMLKTSENKEIYRNLRREYRNSLRFKRKNYVNKMIEECGNDAKKMYRVVNCLTNGDGEVMLPDQEEDKVVANKFMDFLNKKL